MYAVVGITGNTGNGVAKTLLSKGRQVRGIVRDEKKAAEWRARGADVVVAELFDREAMTAAFAEVDGVYLMTPTYFETEDMFAANTRDLTSLTQAMIAAGVPKVVYLSSIGAHRTTDTGAILKLHEMEQLFFQLPIASASIRASWFIENFAGLVGAARETGILPSFLNPLDRVIPMIATKDISATAADLLLETWTGRRVIELEGPQRWSPNDVAQAIAKVLKRDVVAKVVGRDQWLSAYQSWGLTPRSARAMAEMMEGFNRQWIEFEGQDTERRVGSTSLEEVFRPLIRE